MAKKRVHEIAQRARDVLEGGHRDAPEGRPRREGGCLERGRERRRRAPSTAAAPLRRPRSPSLSSARRRRPAARASPRFPPRALRRARGRPTGRPSRSSRRQRRRTGSRRGGDGQQPAAADGGGGDGAPAPAAPAARGPARPQRLERPAPRHHRLSGRPPPAGRTASAAAAARAAGAAAAGARRGSSPTSPQPEEVKEELPTKVNSGATVKEVAESLGLGASEVIKKLMELGEMATLTQTLTDEAIEVLADAFEKKVTIVSAADDVEEVEETYDDAGGRARRPPAGHHRHGPRRPRQDVAARRRARDRGRGR